MEKNWNAVLGKIHKIVSIRQQVDHWKSVGEKIVFTNGCFDLVHLGHLQYLSQAKTLGDRLIIGVNSDKSVQNLKGAHRPIKDEHTRAALLAAMTFVDAVIIFSSQTPLQLIKDIKPNVLCKGGDWAVEEIVGAKEVISWGGHVESIPFLSGHSTTILEQKIQSNI